MPRIPKVVIRRFKQLKEVVLDLQDTSLLVGANNSGKSSILQAIHFAVSIAQSARLVGEGVAWAKGSFALSFSPAQLIYSPVADVMSLAKGGLLQEASDKRIEIEFFRDDNESCVVGLRRGRNRNIAVKITGKTLGEELMNISDPFTVYAPGLAGVPKEEPYMSLGAVRRTVARGDANLVLRNVLLRLSERQAKWQQFLDDMRILFPNLSMEVHFNQETDEYIRASFSLGGGRKLPVDAAGTSILQASQILAYIGLFGPKMLIMDEPDSHLHPDNQRRLCNLVSSLTAARGFQAIVCTHSRHVLDAMRDRAAIFWLNKGAVVEGADANTTSMLLDLGALDSVDYFTNGTLRSLVATEDTDTEAIKALLWSNGFRTAETEIASYSGCSKLESAQVLGSFLREKATHLTFIVHRDRDYLSEGRAKSFGEGLDALGISYFLTSHSDIEGYFLNANHLSFLNPGLSVQRAQELIDAATADTKDKSIKAIVNARTQDAYRVRTETGKSPNPGEIAVQAMRDFEADPVSFRRGKYVLGKLIALIQQEIGVNPRIFSPSEHLIVHELEEIASKIWPPQSN
ncbi:MAG: ATPase [Deltaproteobacteria bacterium]|nr:MAG: ATPase [Deltaproteobacteria bacterium]